MSTNKNPIGETFEYYDYPFAKNIIRKVEFKIGPVIIEASRTCRKCSCLYSQGAYDDKSFEIWRKLAGYKGDIKLCSECDK
jgi:hypothetical protein